MVTPDAAAFVSVILSPARTPAANALDCDGVIVPPAPVPVSVKSTVPVKAATVLLFTSCAVIVGPVAAVPAVCVAGVVTAK